MHACGVPVSTQDPEPWLERKRMTPYMKSYSVFHTDWWLDAVAPSKWAKVELCEDGLVIATWPYVVQRHYGVRISVPPVLTRSLGPHLAKGRGKAASNFRREGTLVRELVGQLPSIHYLHHTLDPKSTLGIHLKGCGFTCGVDYTFRTIAGKLPAELWAEMRDKTRNLIRSANP